MSLIRDNDDERRARVEVLICELAPARHHSRHVSRGPDDHVTNRRVIIGVRRSQMIALLYIMLLVATVVAVDVVFFRNLFWERLAVNIGIVLVFAAFYFRFLKYR
ncbi:MAG TPA: hypothetical protein VLV86_24820 [Vicinamibacterales bacterium]|nr:hypothetical protein [Vicinamibacterales bacterium]